MTKIFVSTLIALTCATLHAQSVIVKGTDAGNIRGTGAGSVKGVVVVTETTYSSNRFSVFSDNTNVVVDNDSGLTWTRDALLRTATNWYASTNWIAELNYAKYDDWRMASITEFSRDETYGATNGLLDDYPSANDPALPLGHPFLNVGTINYWTTTSPVGSPTYAWYVLARDGEVRATPDKNWNTDIRVWPCRGP